MMAPPLEYDDDQPVGRILNGDSIFQNGGNQLLLNVTKESDGYAATFPIGLQLT
jgi:hypothetical protein